MVLDQYLLRFLEMPARLGSVLGALWAWASRSPKLSWRPSQKPCNMAAGISIQCRGNRADNIPSLSCIWEPPSTSYIRPGDMAFGHAIAIYKANFPKSLPFLSPGSQNLALLQLPNFAFSRSYRREAPLCQFQPCPKNRRVVTSKAPP